MIKGVMKKLSLTVFIILSAVFVFHTHSNQLEQHSVDLVVFSCDRPLQLYALLESVQQYARGLAEQHVIYRATDLKFEKGYAIVSQAFPSIQFHKQGANPRADFKPLTITAAFDSPSPYIVFAVDDIVVKDTIDFSECAQALETYGAYGFYLRLGKNLTQCYSWGSRAQAIPQLQHEADDIVSWHFNQGQFDWGYPHTVDMTVYRKKDIESDLKAMMYQTPNSFEDVWNMRSRAIMGKRGVCYIASKIVNMPLNRVQHEYSNRAMNEYSARDLLALFMSGKKMDITPLKCIDNKAAHMEYSPTFILR